MFFIFLKSHHILVLTIKYELFILIYIESYAIQKLYMLLLFKYYFYSIIIDEI